MLYRNSQWQFSTSNDVNPYHSRNNFFSFGDKKMIDAGLHRKLSVKQYSDKLERPVHYAKSSLEQHSKHPISSKKAMNNQLITSGYIPAKGKSYFGNNIKELYNKIQNMKSNLNGKRVIASRQASKQANHTTTDHKLDAQI